MTGGDGLDPPVYQHRKTGFTQYDFEPIDAYPGTIWVSPAVVIG